MLSYIWASKTLFPSRFLLVAMKNYSPRGEKCLYEIATKFLRKDSSTRKNMTSIYVELLAVFFILEILLIENNQQPIIFLVTRANQSTKLPISTTLVTTNGFIQSIISVSHARIILWMQTILNLAQNCRIH